MKILYVAALIILGANISSVKAGEEYKNYEVKINDKTYNLNIGDSIQTKDKDGKPLTICLNKKKYTGYGDKFLTFQYDSKFNLASQSVGYGIEQLMIASATGALVLIQEYSSMNPSSMVDMMLHEVTKESINYGYKMSKKSIVKKLSSGKELKGVRAKLKYKQEETYWEILTYGVKDSGVLIATRIDKQFFNLDIKLHNHFWETLKINL